MLGLIRKVAAVAIVSAGATVAMGQTRLHGSGATFPEPLYKKWVVEYQRIKPDVQIDYTGIGSGGGIKDITAKTVAFAGSDAPLSRKEIDAAGGKSVVVEIPSCAGGVVPAYNVPGVTKTLRFSGSLLGDIYLGKIATWNDPAIAALNPGVNLPNLPITTAWRTDGSGTNYVWTNYLATQNETFKETIGMGKQVRWPIGQGGKGNQGVTAIVQQTPGAIGYVEQGYADANHVTYGAVKNKAGKFVKASPESVSMAGGGAVSSMDGNQLTANIWDQPGDEAYPIASFTYLVIYKDLNNIKSKEEAEALMGFLWWATHEGQKLAPGLDYAPLAPGVTAKAEELLKTVTFDGKPVLADK